MPSVFIYLTTSFVSSVVEFVRHWYSGGFKLTMHKTVLTLESLDRTLALQVNLRHFFEPLYQDRSFVGYVLGFVFRSCRVVIAFCVYMLVVTFYLILYLVWASIPLYLIYKFFQPYA